MFLLCWIKGLYKVVFKSILVMDILMRKWGLVIGDWGMVNSEW